MMKKHDIHELEKLQKQLSSNISLKNTFKLEEIKLVAGIDIAYWSNEGIDYGVCCIVVFDYLTKEIIEEIHHIDKIESLYFWLSSI